ncbi:transcriptional regulator [Actinomyces sp. AC-20-1]|uniref:helix-turn-helix transcriptional regulator n=1 Tax=Actinomyces sp. AC-20-1 TaxID=2761167 RepID=UPI002016CDB2|nr:transcriptional regulator [Actinomyces sp. AC-20-1]MCL3793623.1 transcriptional regulator [Actinomyces sp. 217892]
MTEPVRYLSVADVARLLGVTGSTVRSYMVQGRLPEPAVIVGLERESRGWTRESIEEWNASRPGRGARTDLRR